MKNRLSGLFFLILFFASYMHLYFYRVDLDNQLWFYLRSPSFSEASLVEQTKSRFMSPILIEETNVEEKKELLLSIHKKVKGLMLVINEGPRFLNSGIQEVYYSSEDEKRLEAYHPGIHGLESTSSSMLLLHSGHRLPGMELHLFPLEQLNRAAPYSVRFIGANITEAKEEIDQLLAPPIQLPHRDIKVENPILYRFLLCLHGFAFLGFAFFYALQTRRELEIRKSLGHSSLHIFVRQFHGWFFLRCWARFCQLFYCCSRQILFPLFLESSVPISLPMSS